MAKVFRPAAFAALLLAAPASAQILTVDITADELDGACVPGDCSLREALADAADGDEIVFALPGSPPWTIRVSTGLGTLVVEDAVTITGPGTSDLVISGDSDGNGTNDVRVMRIDPTGQPLIQNLTLRDGRATSIADRDGGCVKNLGDVSFLSVRFEDCIGWNGGLNFSNQPGGFGGAIYSGPGTALAVDLCEFVANSGGIGDIDPGGTTGTAGGHGGAIAIANQFATVRRSTFLANTGGQGGLPNGNGGDGGAIAVLAGGSVLIEDSTFTENRTGDGRTNALPNGADGRGGALFFAADATLNNVTLSGNAIGITGAGTSAQGGGLHVAGGTTRLRNVTVAGNTANGAGGGIARSVGTLRVRNSLIALNTGGGTSEDCTTNAPASLISEGWNLVGVNNGCAASFVGTGDQVGTSAAPLDPQIGALASNGGPTQTRALQTGSPAIDAGDPSDCDAWDPLLGVDVPMTADQRAFPRPLDGDGDATVVCDTGAYEAPTFVPIDRSLTVTLAGSGTGSVTSVPAGIACPSDCDELYPDGTVVDLSATADPGSTFVAWSGDCTGSGACQVTMSADRSVTATFDELFTLSVSVTGSGTVTSSPAGISCGADCTEDYADGTVVTLSQAADPGWVFTGWSGDCTGTGACQVTMDADHSVSATFVQLRTLTVAVSGSGTVASSPAGISCPSDCTEDYAQGTVVTLTPTPSPGWLFTGWGGNCTGTGVCQVTMNGNRSVSATFTQQFTLTVSVTGSGTVTSTPSGISCPSDCSEPYLDGTLVTLTPAASPGWLFTGWGGDCTGTGGCQVTMSAAHAVSATFTQLFTLDVTVTGSGTVTSLPAGIDCPGDCSEAYLAGTLVDLTADPAAGWLFAGWSGDCTGTGACQVTMSQARSVDALFDTMPFLDGFESGDTGAWSSTFP